MKAQTLKLFPNFAKIIRRSGSKRNLQNLKEEGASSQNVYVNYVTHVNSLNGFKKEMCDTSLIDDVAKLVYSGETLLITRSCIGEINVVWNNWERCYDILKNDYFLLDDKALMVSRTFKDSIKSLNALCENPNDPYAKDNLNFTVQYMKTYLTDSIGITETVINEVHDFHDISYDKQYEYFDKIIAQLSKESSLKEKERDAVTARIRQLRNDIASYNASIAALAISLGVSCTMIVGTFFISGGYGIVITLFVLPAVAAAVTELVKIVSKLKTAKKEIAEYGDYENEYNRIIRSLDNLKSTTETSKMEAGLIKRDLEDVNAPWKALSEDISHIYEIVKNDSFTDYEKMRDAFEEIEKEWTKLRNNLSSLNLDASVSKVVSVDNVVAEKDFLLSLAQKEGISMESYVFA